MTSDREKRILIVDDDRDFRDQLSLHLLNSFKRNETVSLVERVRAALHASSGEDESDDRDFTPEPYVIHCASQGQQAYEMVQQALHEGKPYALIFLDIRMPPGWDGVITLEHIWKIDKKVQVVLCSAHSIYSWKEVVEKFGKKDNLLILKKPFDTTVVTQIALALTEKYLIARNAERIDGNAELYLKHIIDGLPVPLIITAPDGRITQFNRAAVELIGKPAAELVQLRLWDAIPDLAKCNEDIREVLSGKKQISRTQFVNLDGQRQNMDVTVYPMGVGTPGASAIIRLLRHTNAVPTPGEAEYLKTVDSIYEAVSKLKDDLAADDLNLLKSKLTQDINRLEGIAKQSEIIIKKVMESSVADLAAEMDDALSDCRDLLCAVHVERDFPTERLFCSIPGNQLKLCFWNLIVNAAEAVKIVHGGTDRGRIEISLSTTRLSSPVPTMLPEAEPGEYQMIRIADNGGGIPADIMGRIFEPFFSTKRTSGLGLVLVYNIMKQYNGHIRVETEIGRGSVFTLYLPIAGQA